MRISRRFLGFMAVCSLLVVVPGTTASAQAPPPEIVVEDGITQPVFSADNAIAERLWVETEVDTFGDGSLDRVIIDVYRPGETETENFKVPVVFEQSPYRGPTWTNPPWHNVDFDDHPASIFRHQSEVARRGPAPQLEGALANYYVPRGYGVVRGRSIGTGGSDGCPTTGDEAETLGTKAVIDWLNGSARAFDESGDEVLADWTTGDVGMVGSSYLGTLPIMVATTGVEGLKTIVPVAAISDWYNYYRQNGTPVPAGGWQGDDADLLGMWTAGQVRSLGDCAEEFAKLTEAQDRVSGNYNAFWDERNYLPRVKDIEASVFVVHGRNDTNVKLQHASELWERLTHFKIDRKIWLHNGGHGPPGANARYTLPDGTSWTYQQTVNRWFDHWLWGVDNGIMDEPRAIVQHVADGNLTHADWPDPAMKEVTVRLTANSPDEIGGLTTTHVAPPKQAKQSFVDDGRNITATMGAPRRPTRSTSLIMNPDEVSPNRLVYVSDVLTGPLRLSGTPSLRLRASVDNRSAATLTAYLVDYGPPGSTGASNKIAVSRGWMSAQNRVSRDRTSPIMQGKMYDFEWALQPHDYMFEGGRRIGLVILSTDFDYTLRPLPGTQLTVDPGFGRLTLPLVGNPDF